MKKSKTQKGITLVALIITIIVLLILAAVAISSITNYGIIGHAQNSATQFNQAQKDEEDFLDQYLAVLKDIGNVDVGEVAEKPSTMDGRQYTATNPVIPKGFFALNTTTAKWDAEDLAAEVKKGLVISDGTNEFVWIPVANISEMAIVTSETDANGRTNYKAKLDNVDSGAVEPSNTTHDNATNLSIWTPTLFQEEFNKMVESVVKYKGFYMGRYEMSLSASGIAQSAKGKTSATAEASSANTWYGFHEKAKTYGANKNLGVESEMLWSCQYDAMLRWMRANEIDVDNTAGVDNIKNKSQTTGSVSTDIFNNVYDLLGNRREWTQENSSSGNGTPSNRRAYRGGGFSTVNTSVAYRSGGRAPTVVENAVGSRLTLYVEV